MAADLQQILPRPADIGLEVNATISEFICLGKDQSMIAAVLPGMRKVELTD